MDKWLIIPILIGVGLGQLIKWLIAGLSIPAVDIAVTGVVLIGLGMMVKHWSSWPPRPVLFGWSILMVAIALSWLVNLSALGVSNGLIALLFLGRFIIYGLLPIVLWPHLNAKRSVVYAGWLLVLFLWVAVLGWLQLGLFPDLVLFEYLGLDPHNGRLVSTFLDPNLVGIFLSFGVGLGILMWGRATSRRDKVIIAVVSVFLIVSVLATFSRSALLAMVVILLMIGWMRYRRVVGIGLIIVALAFMSIPRLQDRLSGVWQLDVTVRYRIESWQAGWRLIKAKPIFGVGYNAIASQRYQYSPAGTERLSRQAENGFDSSLLTMAAASGLVGLLAFLNWLIIILKRTWRSWTVDATIFGPLLWAVTAGLMGASLFVNAWLTATILIIWWLIIGVGLKEQE